ncbi:hypothetical protein FKW77_007540 [Venturia effusa]|uniref:Uncharacterized protein n=1 Tax=Venturia effusa TaxID=50376 RepID=A0A517LLS1_9PEZI|nr:hypothetical protein FKW77_007540 [Venturia effusa]
MSRSSSSLQASQQYNSTTTALTTPENTSPVPTLENIHDHLSIIKHIAHTSSPRNAHNNLNAVHLGLDDASSKLVTFQDGLKRTCSAAVFDSDTPVAFYTISDTLLDVLREVELAPEKIAFEGKTKRSLKETWRNLKTFGPLVGERQLQLRMLYISTLSVVMKVLALSFTLPYILEKEGLIDSDWIFQVKRCVLTQGFTQSFGTDPLKSNTSCDIGLPLPLLISCSSKPPIWAGKSHSRQAEIRRRNSALEKAHAETSRLGRVNGGGWVSGGAIIQHGVPTLTNFEQTVQAIRDLTVESREVGSEDEEDDSSAAQFKPVDYNQLSALPSQRSSRIESHKSSCPHPQAEEDYFSTKHKLFRPQSVPTPIRLKSETPAKPTATFIPTTTRTESEPPRFDSPIDSLLAPDLTETHFYFHNLKRHTDAEQQRELKKDSGAGFESEDESQCSMESETGPLEMPSPRLWRDVVGGYFDF